MGEQPNANQDPACPYTPDNDPLIVIAGRLEPLTATSQSALPLGLLLDLAIETWPEAKTWLRENGRADCILDMQSRIDAMRKEPQDAFANFRAMEEARLLILDMEGEARSIWRAREAKQQAAAAPRPGPTDQTQVSMTTLKKPIPQAIPVPLPKTAPELLAYIHNQVNAILGYTREFKSLPAGMTPDLFLGFRRDVVVGMRESIGHGLLELERTGYAVPDRWREWLPRPADQGQTMMSSQPCYLWPLANYDDVCRLEVQVELAIKALAGGGFSPPKNSPTAETVRKFDAFLCHASEDKTAVVIPFAEAMEQEGLNPWFDKGEIAWGDNLAQKIQEGLSKSKFVVVFLSNDFLRGKHWTDAELNAAISIEIGGRPFVLPILLGITHRELHGKYPLVSAKVYKEIPDYDVTRPVPQECLKNLIAELRQLICRVC
jgi:hypothetical protein